MAFTQEDEQIIDEIVEDEKITEIQAKVNREIKARFGMSASEFYNLPDDETERLLASDKSLNNKANLDKKVEQAKADLEDKPILPSELSKREFTTYRKLVENGADSEKAIDWLKNNDFGEFDDTSLKAISKRLISDDKIRENVGIEMGKALISQYIVSLQKQGLSTANVEDRYKQGMTLREVNEVIALDRNLQLERQREQEAIAEAKKIQDRAQASKWIAEAKQLGIRPDATLIAQRLGCKKADIEDLCR